MLDLNILKNIELKEFPLKNRGVLYFSPDRLGLLEGSPLVGEVLRKARNSRSTGQLLQEMSGEFPRETLEETLGQLEALYRRGLIGPGDGTWHYQNRTGPVIRFIISNTSSCNMACKYCYNSFQENQDGFRQRQDLDGKTILRALELLGEVSGPRTQLEILFIGGEPLVAFDVIAETARTWRSVPSMAGKNLRLFLITNGTLLTDEVYRLCSENNVHIKISLDGPREVHDRMRVFPGGLGSYDAILDQLPDYFSRYRHPCKAVTATVDSYNQDLMRLVEHFTALGFNQVELTELYESCPTCTDSDGRVAPVFSKAGGRVDTLEEKYRELYRFLEFRILSRQYLNLIPLFKPLLALHTRVPNHYPCRVGLNSVALFTDGRFYPCHHYMGDEDHALGDLESGIDMELFNSLRKPVNLREECSICWARNLCGGFLLSPGPEPGGEPLRGPGNNL